MRSASLVMKRSANWRRRCSIPSASSAPIESGVSGAGGRPLCSVPARHYVEGVLLHRLHGQCLQEVDDGELVVRCAPRRGYNGDVQATAGSGRGRDADRPDLPAACGLPDRCGRTHTPLESLGRPLVREAAEVATRWHVHPLRTGAVALLLKRELTNGPCHPT